jgi:acetyltransferase-like isoleucine patch superfamily enzyme
MSDDAEGWRARTSGAARAAREEMANLFPRKVLAEKLSELLPRQTFNRTRTALLKAAGVRVGPRSLLLSAVRLTGIGDPCRFLTIGKDTIITGPIHADLGAPLRIGDNVRIGHDVAFLTINHEIGAPQLRSGTSFFAPIDVGDGVWIASRVTVLPGVTIGNSSIVAAGALVARDVPPNTLVAGVPARVVRAL